METSQTVPKFCMFEASSKSLKMNSKNVFQNAQRQFRQQKIKLFEFFNKKIVHKMKDFKCLTIR